MPSENEELIRRALTHLRETGDIYYPGLDPNVEWHTRSGGPTSDVYRGIEDVRRFVQGWTGAFDDFEIDIETIIDRGEHIIVSLVHRGRFKGGSEMLTLAETYVYKMRDGKAIEVREYSTLDEALQAFSVSVSDHQA